MPAGFLSAPLTRLLPPAHSCRCSYSLLPHAHLWRQAMVGCLLKDSPKGDFISKFRDALTAETSFQQVEIAPGLGDLLAAKDSTELACVKRASIFSAVVMQKFLVQQIESIVDEERKITHEQLASDTEDAFTEPLKLGVKVPSASPQ